MGGWVVVVVVCLDYNVSSGPFFSYEIEIGDGPGPELDNLYYLQLYNYFKQFPQLTSLIIKLDSLITVLFLPS